MSAIIGLIVAGVIGRVLVPAGAKLISEVINGVQRTTMRDADGVQKDPSLVPLKRVQGIKDLRSRMTTAASNATRNVDAAKQEVLQILASTRLYATDTAQFRSRIEVLKNAATIEGVRAAGLALADAAVQGHQHLVTSGVQLAVRNAAIKNGFGKIDALHSPLGNDIIRLAATDELGRSIVTEIDARPDRDLKIEAEVVGVTDNSCHAILDQFYSALQQEGIEMSAPPKRKPTGGICELAATKAFLAKKLKPSRTRKASAPDVTEDEDDRRVRMNRTSSAAKSKLTN